MFAFRRWLPTLFILVAAGCIPTSTSDRNTASEEEVASSSPSKCCAADSACEACCAADTTSTSTAAEKKDAIELKTVKYAGLVEAVRAHKGKVVVVDIWASFCVPCKKEFPHLVELHRKYGPDGVVCMSVSVDEPEAEEEALAFLKKVKATFPNYRLDEETTFWQDKWDLKGIPAVFVFDREGKRAAKFTMDDPDNQFNYKDNVEPLVRKLIKK